MAKYLILILIVTLVALFYPYRDLYVREDSFSDDYQLIAKGFWTRESCVEAAQAQRAEDFRCRQRTLFGSMLNTSGRYAQSGLDR